MIFPRFEIYKIIYRFLSKSQSTQTVEKKRELPEILRDNFLKKEKVKQLSKEKSKNEIKQLPQDARNRIAVYKTLDDDFETTAEKENKKKIFQKREQEEDLDIYQKHVFQQLKTSNNTNFDLLYKPTETPRYALLTFSFKY